MSGQEGAEEEEDGETGERGGSGGKKEGKGRGASEGFPQEQDFSAEQAEEEGETFRGDLRPQNTAGYRSHPPAGF